MYYGRGRAVDADVPYTRTCRGRGRAVDADAARTRTPADTDAARTRTPQIASGRRRARTWTCHGRGRHSDAKFWSLAIFSRDTVADRADSAADDYAKSVADGSSGQADAVMSLLSDDEVMPPRRARSVGSLPTADVMGHSGLIKNIRPGALYICYVERRSRDRHGHSRRPSSMSRWSMVHRQLDRILHALVHGRKPCTSGAAVSLLGALLRQIDRERRHEL